MSESNIGRGEAKSEGTGERYKKNEGNRDKTAKATTNNKDRRERERVPFRMGRGKVRRQLDKDRDSVRGIVEVQRIERLGDRKTRKGSKRSKKKKRSGIERIQKK